MKKIISILLAMVMLMSITSIAAAEETYTRKATEDLFPILEEGSDEITLKIAVSCADSDGPVEDMWFFKWLENATGINLEVTGFPKSVWDARKNLIMSTGEFYDYDIFYGFDWSANEIYRYGLSGMFLPLNEYIEKQGKAFKTICDYMGEDFLAQATAPDGNVYSLPFQGNPRPEAVNNKHYALALNMSMLEQLNLETPSSFEELYDVLDAMNKAGMNGVMNVEYDKEFRGATLSAYRIITIAELNNNLAIKQNAEGGWDPIFLPLDEDYKAWLKAMNRFYEAGMLDESMFTTNRTTSAAENQANPAAVIQGDYVTSIGEFPEIFNQYHTWLPNQDETRDPVTYIKQAVGLGAFVISSSCEHPDVAYALCDVLYDPILVLMINWGPYIRDPFQYDELAQELKLGYDIIFDENGAFSSIVTDSETIGWDPAVYSNSTHQLRQIGAPSWVYGTSLIPTNTVYARMVAYNAPPANPGGTPGAAQYTFRMQQITEDMQYVHEPMKHIYLAPEAEERVAEMHTELNDYVASCEGLFISGEMNLEEDYDEFVQQLKDMGAEEYLKIYSDAYYATEK